VTAATVDCESGFINSAGTVRRLQALVAVGWPQAQLARRLGMRWAVFADLMRSEQVSHATAAAVRRVYDQLWGKPPTGRYATRARAFARARNWPPPLGWDEDCGDGHDIDDPDATPAPGWKRTGRQTHPRAELIPEAGWLLAQGYTRAQAAERLRVSTAALCKAIARTRLANLPLPAQEGQPMSFDPAPRAAPERFKGAAFAHEMVLRQVDAGVPAEQIRARHTAAVATLTQAARSDSEREFLGGFAATGQDHIDTLRDTQQAQADQLRWERDQEAAPAREAG
jgi:hypothetical protein